MPDEDRRIRRTRRALTGALLALAAEQPYETITIRDITDRADIGYATFFRHYEGKDDLMLAIFEEIVQELEVVAGAHREGFFEQEGLLIFQHVQEHEALYRSVLDSLTFRRKLKALFVGLVGERMEGHMSQIPDAVIPQEVAIHHVVTSLVGLIEWWLDRAHPLPVEQMALLYDRLIIRATWYTIPASNVLLLPWEQPDDGAGDR